MPTSKKLRKYSAATRHHSWNDYDDSTSHEKKSTFYKEQNPKKAAAYLEKIKDIPEEKLVYVDEIGIQTQIYWQYAHSPRG